MTVAVVQFGGSNCDRDAVRALEHLGIDAERVWHEDGLPDGVDGVLLPGGFSYGDYLRAGAMAARSPIMNEVREAAEDGTPVLGVCNGAQIGTEARMVPGAFTTNRSARFQCEHVYLRVENADPPWTAAYDEGEVIEIPIANGEGRFEIGAAENGASGLDTETYERLEADDRILFRYCDADGDLTDAANPNGSTGAVAGLLGDRESVAVLMPHPERATLPDVGGTDGQGILRGFA